MEIGCAFSKNFFLLYSLCLLLQIWSSSSGLADQSILGHLCLFLLLQLTPFHCGQCQPNEDKVQELTKRSSARIFPPFLFCQHSQLPITCQNRSDSRQFSSHCVWDSAGFQSNWFSNMVTGLMQCGGAETRYMNQYKVIKQQQLNTVFSVILLFCRWNTSCQIPSPLGCLLGGKKK